MMTDCLATPGLWAFGALALAFFLVVVWTAALRSQRTRRSRKGLPPPPPAVAGGLPLLGNALALARHGGWVPDFRRVLAGATSCEHGML